VRIKDSGTLEQSPGKAIPPVQAGNPSPKHVAVLTISALGDFVLAIPLLQQIRTSFVDPRITVVCLIPAVEALVQETGLADSIVKLPSQSRRSPLQLITALAAIKRIGADITLQTVSSHGTFANLLVAASGAAIRCGFAVGKCQSKLTHTVPMDPTQHRVVLNLNLLRRLGHVDVAEPVGRYFPNIESRSSRFDTDPIWKSFGRYVVVSVGSDPKLYFKRWSADKWVALSRMLSERGISPVFVGSASERHEIGSIIDQAGCPAFNLAGDTSFADLASLINSSLTVVGTDGMVLHMASALDKRCVAIFGPTDPGVVGPWGDMHVKLWMNLPCSPCYGASSLGKGITCKTYECLTSLSVQRAAEAVITLALEAHVGD
jgi:ADP-heptose:LPS heptosyltransferase